MPSGKLKQAVSGDELVDYYGTWETGFEVAQAEGERRVYLADIIKELFRLSASHNPLIDGQQSAGSSDKQDFAGWMKAVLGRDIGDDEVVRLYAVFAGEGMPPEAFFPDGRLSDIWPPTISPLSAAEGCIGRVCVYQEKRVFLLVRLERVWMDGNALWLEIDVLPGPFDNGASDIPAGQRLRIGGDSESMRVRSGRLEFSNYVSWSLLTGGQWIEFLAELAAMKLSRQELFARFRDRMDIDR